MPVNTLHVITKRSNYLTSVLWYAAANASHNMKLFLMLKSLWRSHCLICKCLELWKQSSPICTSPQSPDYLLCTPAYLSRRKAYWLWPVTLQIQVNTFNRFDTPLLLCPSGLLCGLQLMIIRADHLQMLLSISLESIIVEKKKAKL